MKQDLTRAEKVALIKKLAQELDVKQRQRVFDDPLPAQGDEQHRELSQALYEKAHALMADHACAAPREERLAEERKLLDAAVKANPCHFGALQSRAAVHLELKMWKEAEDDGTSVEHILRVANEIKGFEDIGRRTLVNCMYIAACAKIEQGRFEDAHRDLHAAQLVDTDDPRVGERLEKVHRILDDYKERFGSNVQAQQIERTTEYSMYGLSLYELGLLYEAGIPPWYGIAKTVLNMVDGMKSDVDARKSRDHHETQQCHHCFTSKSDGAALLLCAKCRAALYCSKACQQKDWPGHKAHCKTAAAAREAANANAVKAHPLFSISDLPTAASELSSALQGWTGKHRPLLAQSLAHALDLRADPKAHETKAMIATVQWMSGPQSTATRFKVVAVDVQDIASSIQISSEAAGILKTRAHLDSQWILKGGYGVAMMVIICISTSPFAMNIAPVSLLPGIDRDTRNVGWAAALMAKLG